MAGHSHAKNVMHRKAAQNNKKAKLFTKISRAITIAIKLGGSNDPNVNSKLRYILKQAQAASISKDIIKRAIEKSSQIGSIEEVLYEGYGPGGIALLIEAATDNKTRTAAEIRSIFNKFGGAMGEPNSVSFMFDRMTEIECDIPEEKFDEFFADALELGALDVVENMAFFASENFGSAQSDLEKKWSITNAQLCYIPKNLIEIDDSSVIETFEKMINLLEENESTQNCWHNLKE